jgi:hypothetical protein
MARQRGLINCHTDQGKRDQDHEHGQVEEIRARPRPPKAVRPVHGPARLSPTIRRAHPRVLEESADEMNQVCLTATTPRRHAVWEGS